MALIYMISRLITLYEWIIIIRAVISWFEPNPYNPFYHFLIKITEPFLAYFRRMLGSLTYRLRIDLSPLIAIIALEILRRIVFIVLL